jgi:hypothetical protein
MADDPTATVELEPRLTDDQLKKVAWRLALVTALMIGGGMWLASSLGLFTESARGVNNTRVLGNTIAVWLALTGLVVLMVGAIAALADLRKLKGASALIVAGILLMITSGLLAWQSVPDAPCESDLTVTSETGSPTATTVISETTTRGIGPCAAPAPAPTTTAPAEEEAGDSETVPGAGTEEPASDDTATGDEPAG